MPKAEKEIDRGAQRVSLALKAIELGIVPEGTERLTHAQLFELLEKEAVDRMHFPPLTVFQEAVEIIKDEESEHRGILTQLSQIGALTHIAVPATLELLQQFSQSATETYRSRALSEDLKTGLAERFAGHLQKNFQSSESQETAIVAIRALRGYGIIADDIIRQLLWRVQTTGEITFAGLEEVFGRTGLLLQSTSGMEALANELLRAEKFMQASRRGIKRKKYAESPESVTRRSSFLLKSMALLTQEYIEEHGNNEQTAEFAAQLLVKAFFAHQLHWANPKEQVINLGLELSEPSIALDQPINLEDVLAQFLLEAQLAGLVDPPSAEDNEEAMTKEEYEMLGLTSQQFEAHQRIVESRIPAYTENPLADIPPEARVVTILGFYNLSHLGYIALAGATVDILRRFPSKENKRPWFVIISINQRDLKREKRSLMPNEPPAFPLDKRVSLSLTNLSGIVGNGVVFSSIENVVGHSDDVPERLTAFNDLITSSGMKLERACGFDRRGFGRPYMERLILGLRGRDLLQILKEADRLEEIKERLPESQIDIVLLSGVSAHSSSRAWNAARNYLTKGKPRQLLELRAMTHRKTTDEILSLVRKELEERGEVIVINT